MDENALQRRLVAILAADVVGFSRLTGADEDRTLARLRALRSDLIDPTLAVHNGRVVKRTGDGVIAEFRSVVDAVRCAVEIQNAMIERNAGVPPERRIEFRIGVHLGDVVEERDGDLMGDGVNIAARLEGIAAPGAICLSEDAYRQVRSRLDLSVSDLGDMRLKNISEPMRIYSLQVGIAADAKSGPRQEPKASVPSGPSEKPTIAVLPFQNMSGDPSQQYVSDGVAEDIITGLSQFKNLAVSARHVSFHIGGKNDPLTAARELGLDYVVEGSVRSAGDRIRITAQLIETTAGNHIWAERYDRASNDVFAVQDEVVTSIVATVEGRMVSASAATTRKRPTASWSAYDHLLQGRELCNFYKEPDAISHFRRAVAIDSDYAHGHAWLALALTVTYILKRDKSYLQDAELSAQRALEIDSNDPTVNWASAMVKLWSGNHDQAGVYFDRAIALNPADIQIRADRALWLRYTGKLDAALAAIDDCLKQGPFAPHWFWIVRGQILFDLERYSDAINSLSNLPEKGIRTEIYLAAALAKIGDQVKSMAAVERARTHQLELRTKDLVVVEPHMDRSRLEHLQDALRQAGLPE